MVVSKKHATKRVRNKPAATPGRDRTGFIATRPNVRIEMVLIEKTALLFLVSLAKTVQAERPEGHQMLTRDHALDSAINLAQGALGIQEKVVKMEQVERMNAAIAAATEDTADSVINAS